MMLLTGMLTVSYFVIWLAVLVEDRDEPMATLAVGAMIFALVGMVAVVLAAIK